MKRGREKRIEANAREEDMRGEKKKGKKKKA